MNVYLGSNNSSMLPHVVVSVTNRVSAYKFAMVPSWLRTTGSIILRLELKVVCACRTLLASIRTTRDKTRLQTLSDWTISTIRWFYNRENIFLSPLWRKRTRRVCKMWAIWGQQCANTVWGLVVHLVVIPITSVEGLRLCLRGRGWGLLNAPAAFKPRS